MARFRALLLEGSSTSSTNLPLHISKSDNQQLSRLHHRFCIQGQPSARCRLVGSGKQRHRLRQPKQIQRPRHHLRQRRHSSAEIRHRGRRRNGRIAMDKVAGITPWPSHRLLGQLQWRMHHRGEDQASIQQDRRARTRLLHLPAR